jgi:hypothetical protein
MTIEFELGHFRNRTIKFYPLKLAGPGEIIARHSTTAPEVDGRLSDEVWREGNSDGDARTWQPLIGMPPRGGRRDRVCFAADDQWLYFGGRFATESGRVQAKPDAPSRDVGRLVLQGEHVRVLLADGNGVWTFALTPEQTRFAAAPSTQVVTQWRARAAGDSNTWTAEMAIPRTLFLNLDRLRANVVRREKVSQGYNDLELCPTYGLGDDPDLIPDWRSGDKPERFARLLMK